MRVRDVVVTGLGVVVGPDCGSDALAETLRCDNKTSIVDDRQYHELGAPVGRSAHGVDLSPWVPSILGRHELPPICCCGRRPPFKRDLQAQSAVRPPPSSCLRPWSVSSTEQLLGPPAATDRRLSRRLHSRKCCARVAGQIAIFTGPRPNITLVQRSRALTAAGRALSPHRAWPIVCLQAM
jgi:hypothetical protein